MGYDPALPLEARKTYVTTTFAAAYLNVDRRSVQLYCQNGQLKAKKTGNLWLIYRSSLKAFEKPKKGNPQWRKK